MELTGKCLEEFNQWFFIYDDEISERVKKILIGEFYALGNSYKYGVYVDFFDSVGISITIEAVTSKMFNFRINRWGKEHCIVHGFKSRSETRTAAIEKANQIFNER